MTHGLMGPTMTIDIVSSVTVCVNRLLIEGTRSQAIAGISDRTASQITTYYTSPGN